MLHTCKFIAIVCVICITMSACSTAVVQDTSLAVTPESAEAQIGNMDQKVWQVVDANLKVLPLLPGQKALVESYLNGGDNVPTSGRISIDLSSQKFLAEVQYITEKAPAFVIPTIVVAGEKWAPVYATLKDVNTNMAWSWVQVFHWVNHLGPTIGSYYNLSSSAAVIAKLWQQGIAGNAIIYYLPATESMSGQYMVVGRAVINGIESSFPWAAILNESGEPVTAFNTALAHSVESGKEAARFLSKSFSRGWVQVTADDLPESIRSNWSTGVPSLIKIIMWGVGYQLRVLAASVGITLSEAATQLAAFASKVATVAKNFGLPLIIFYYDPCTSTIPYSGCVVNQ